MSTGTIRIEHPCNGDIVNRHDGEETEECLLLDVSGSAPNGELVEVNGVQVRAEGGRFACSVPITSRRNVITARCGDGSDSITVLWDRGSRKRYRFSSDDNIQFLKDLGTQPDRYPSLFDHWYLAFWRRMHETFGAKIHINIYYQTEGFDLTQMPAKWKEEWQENSDWLHLTFHALQDTPNEPYRNASYSQMAHDFDLVTGHIRRFAGNEVLSRATTVHFAEATKEACREACRALHDRGIERLMAMFSSPEEVHAYYLSDEVIRHAAQRDAWYDAETDLIFIDCDAVVNTLAVEEIVPHLERKAADPHTGELIELLIHEQYFREDLPGLYQPDITAKVETALRWVTDNGYEPVFWGDGFLGNPTVL